MKKKSIMTLVLAVSLVVMALALTACRDDRDDDGTPTGNGANHQSSDGITIPPDAQREVQGAWSDDDASGSEDSYAVEDVQVFEVDLGDGNNHSYSRSAGG